MAELTVWIGSANGVRHLLVTKPQLAHQILESAFRAGVPAARVTLNELIVATAIIAIVCQLSSQPFGSKRNKYLIGLMPKPADTIPGKGD